MATVAPPAGVPTTGTGPEYADEALTLLRIALRAGAGAELLATDPELDPIRNTPAFRELAEAAKQTRPGK